MKDYEQLYYDLQYENKELKNKIKQLEQQIDIYKSMSKNKDIKSIIIEDLSNYLILKENKVGD